MACIRWDRVRLKCKELFQNRGLCYDRKSCSLEKSGHRQPLYTCFCKAGNIKLGPWQFLLTDAFQLFTYLAFGRRADNCYAIKLALRKLDKLSSPPEFNLGREKEYLSRSLAGVSQQLSPPGTKLWLELQNVPDPDPLLCKSLNRSSPAPHSLSARFCLCLVMRTSRVSRETAHVTKVLTPTRKRQTRSSLASFSASAHLSPSKAQRGLDGADDTSSLSSAQSSFSQDESKARTRPGKRKRGAETPATTPGSTTVTQVSVTTRTSPRKRIVKVEQDLDIEEAGVSTPRKARRQPAKQEVDAATGEVKIHPPPNWEEVYKATQEMRKLVLAPVDTMGCERAGENARTPRVSGSTSHATMLRTLY